MQRVFVSFVSLGALFASSAVKADPQPVAPVYQSAPAYAEQEGATPPPPPATIAQPPAPVAYNPAPVQAAPAGQWVYTQQYGWIWAPYDQGYTQVTADSSQAYEYVYYPSYGWRWVVAPWILGIGVVPHWGIYGPSRYAWYSRPWFHVGARPYYGGGVARSWGGYGYRGAPVVRSTWGHTVAPRATFRTGGSWGGGGAWRGSSGGGSWHGSSGGGSWHGSGGGHGGGGGHGRR